MRMVTFWGWAVILCLAAGPARAVDIQSEFSGIKWGAELKSVAGLSEQSRQQDVVYYGKSGDSYVLGDVTMQHVVYGFYQDRFFAAFLPVASAKDVEKIKNHLTAQYGPVRAQLRIDRTIYIWQHGDIKIKLKSYEDKPEAKLCFYYTPLSSKLNESRMESDFEKAIKLD